MCDFSYILIFLPLFSKPAWALLKAALMWKENPMDGVWWDDGCVLARCLTLEARVDVLVVVVRSTSETAALSTQVFREVMKTILSECSRKRSGEDLALASNSPLAAKMAEQSRTEDKKYRDQTKRSVGPMEISVRDWVMFDLIT